MTTKTDLDTVMELKSKYAPAKQGILSKREQDLITDILEIKSRTNIELQNIRDMTTLVYTQFGHAATVANDGGQAMALMDAVSAITAVIDIEKTNRGIPV